MNRGGWGDKKLVGKHKVIEAMNCGFGRRRLSCDRPRELSVCVCVYRWDCQWRKKQPVQVSRRSKGRGWDCNRPDVHHIGRAGPLQIAHIARQGVPIEGNEASCWDERRAVGAR